MDAPARTDYPPSWYAATMVPAPDRGPLRHDLDVDACVIGAGFAGLTTAREIARRGWSVALLEAGRVAWAASGRNNGFVLPGFAQEIDRIIERVGLDHAKRLWELSELGLEYVRTTIRQTRMPGVEPADGWLYVSKVEEAEHFLEIVRILGQDIGAEVEGWPTERVRDVLRSRHYFHAMHFPRAFHVHPLNYALGLAAAAEEAGVHIYEGTPAISIDADGVRKRVVTPTARVRCRDIVLAGNLHIGGLMPRVAGTLLPIWTYLVTTAHLGSRLSEVISYSGCVSDGERADNHYRVVDGDRLLISGRATTWENNPQRFVSGLKSDIAALYPRLGEVDIEYAWTGALGRTAHRMPQIGELTPGVWLASGFGGHGFNTTAMAGNVIASAVCDGDDTWRLFQPFELIWTGGKAGRIAAQVGYWWSRAREQGNARHARDRESEYHKREASHGPLEAEPEDRSSESVAVALRDPSEIARQ